MQAIPTQTITLTFGDVSENHAGMQQIGTRAADGFNLEDFTRCYNWFIEHNHQHEIKVYDLKTSLIGVDNYEHVETAYLLVIRQGLDTILSSMNPSQTADDLYREQTALQPDTKAKMRGRVVNKIARHNLCFGPYAQTANFEAGQGTVIAFDQVPLLNSVLTKLPEILGDKGRNLTVEGNYYYDPSCGIGYHGDSERMRVIGVRLGLSTPLCYQWYYQTNPVGHNMPFILNHGDIYIMSQKATGNDWKKRSIFTLRHSAGAEAYTKVK